MIPKIACSTNYVYVYQIFQRNIGQILQILVNEENDQQGASDHQTVV